MRNNSRTLDGCTARESPACTAHSALPLCLCVGVHSISCTLDDFGVHKSPACTAHSASPLCLCVGVHSTSCIGNVCSDRKTQACPVVGDLLIVDCPACPAFRVAPSCFMSACPSRALDSRNALDKLLSACLVECPRYPEGARVNTSDRTLGAGKYMWADGLTKREKILRRHFLEWLSNVKFRLKE